MSSSLSSDMSPDALFRLNEAKDKSSLRSPLPKHLLLHNNHNNHNHNHNSPSFLPPVTLLRPKPISPSLFSLSHHHLPLLPPSSSSFSSPLSSSSSPLTSNSTMPPPQLPLSRNTSWFPLNSKYPSFQNTTTRTLSTKLVTSETEQHFSSSTKHNQETFRDLNTNQRLSDLSTVTTPANETLRTVSPDIDQMIAVTSETESIRPTPFSPFSGSHKHNKPTRLNESDIVLHLTQWSINLCECPSCFKSHGDNETKQWINLTGSITIPDPSSSGTSVATREDVGAIIASRPVIDRILPRRLRTSTGLLYELHGPMERGMTQDFPSSFLDSFSDGFPDNWVRLIRDAIETLDIRPYVENNMEEHSVLEDKTYANGEPRAESEAFMDEISIDGSLVYLKSNESEPYTNGDQQAESEIHKTSEIETDCTISDLSVRKNEAHALHSELAVHEISTDMSEEPKREIEPVDTFLDQEIDEREPYANDDEMTETENHEIPTATDSSDATANAVPGNPHWRFPDVDEKFPDSQTVDANIKERDGSVGFIEMCGPVTPHRAVAATVNPPAGPSTPSSIAKRTRRALIRLGTSSKLNSREPSPKAFSPVMLKKKRTSSSSTKKNQPEHASKTTADCVTNQEISESTSKCVAVTQLNYSGSTPKSTTETPYQSRWRAGTLPMDFQTPTPKEETKGKLLPSPRSASASSTAIRSHTTGQTPKSDGETTSKFTRSGRTVVKPGSWWTRFNCIRPVAEVIKEEASGCSAKPTESTSPSSTTRTHGESNGRAGSKTPFAGKRGLKTVKGTATPKEKSRKFVEGTAFANDKSVKSLKKISAPQVSSAVVFSAPAAKSTKSLLSSVASDEAISNVGKKAQRKKRTVETKIREKSTVCKAKADSDHRAKTGSKPRAEKKEGSGRHSVPAKSRTKTTSEFDLQHPENGERGSTDEKRITGIAEPECAGATTAKRKHSKVSLATSGKHPKRRNIPTNAHPVEESVAIKDELLASDVEMVDAPVDANVGMTRKGRRKSQRKQKEPRAVAKEVTFVVDSTIPTSVDPEPQGKNHASDQEIVSITAGKGTLARTRQFRQALMQRNAGHEDDVFESTPYLRRQSLRRQIVEDKLLKTPASSLARRPPIFTPSPNTVGYFAPDSMAPPVDQSPDILKPYDATAKEGYVHTLKSRRQGSGATRSSAEEKKKSLVPRTSSSSSRIDRDLKAALAGERGDLFQVMRYHDEESEEDDSDSED